MWRENNPKMRSVRGLSSSRTNNNDRARTNKRESNAIPVNSYLINFEFLCIECRLYIGWPNGDTWIGYEPLELLVSLFRRISKFM